MTPVGGVIVTSPMAAPRLRGTCHHGFLLEGNHVRLVYVASRSILIQLRY